MGASVAARRISAHAGGGIGLRRDTRKDQSHGYYRISDEARRRPLRAQTLSIRAEIAIVPVTDKVSPNQPDYRVVSQGIEIGAGWVRKGQMSGKDYVSLSIAAPSSAPRRSTPTSVAPPGSPTRTSTPSSGARKTEPASSPLAPQAARGALFHFLLPQPPTHPPRRLARGNRLSRLLSLLKHDC